MAISIRTRCEGNDIEFIIKEVSCGRLRDANAELRKFDELFIEAYSEHEIPKSEVPERRLCSPYQLAKREAGDEYAAQRFYHIKDKEILMDVELRSHDDFTVGASASMPKLLHSISIYVRPLDHTINAKINEIFECVKV